MTRRYEQQDPNWDQLRRQVLGLGERSARKSHYPVLQQRLADLQRFRLLLDAASDAMVLADQYTGRIVDANDAMGRMLGIDNHQLIGQDCHRYLPVPEPLPTRPWTGTLTTVEGTAIDAEISCSHKQVEDRTFVLLVIRDVSDRMAAEQALRASEQKYRTIFEAVNDGLFIHDAETGRLLEYNQQAAAMYGYSFAAFANVSPDDCCAGYDPYQGAGVMRALDEARDGRNSRFEWHARHRDGHLFWVEVTLRRTRIGDQSVILAVVRDIHDRKQAAIEREQLLSELTQRNEELEQFTYTVSHDLKTPLTTIRGFLGFVLQHAEAGRLDQMHEDADRIHQATVKMGRLLDDLLQLSRIGRKTHPPVWVDMTALGRETIGSLPPEVTEVVEIAIEPAMPHVHGDRLRISQIVQNLLSNACRYAKGAERPFVRFGVRVDQDTPVFVVEDNGKGIKPEYHERVFELFEQLDGHESGTGIGLAIVHRCVELHKGRVWVESDGRGKGARFCFTLPDMPSVG